WRKSIMPAGERKGYSAQETADYRLHKYSERLKSTINTNMHVVHSPTSGNFPFTYDTTPFPTAFKRGDDTRPALPTLGEKYWNLQTAHYIAKNTAHCFYNGHPVYKYNKIGDFYEVSEDDPDTVIVP